MITRVDETRHANSHANMRGLSCCVGLFFAIYVALFVDNVSGQVAIELLEKENKGSVDLRRQPRCNNAG